MAWENCLGLILIPKSFSSFIVCRVADAMVGLYVARIYIPEASPPSSVLVFLYYLSQKSHFNFQNDAFQVARYSWPSGSNKKVTTCTVYFHWLHVGLRLLCVILNINQSSNQSINFGRLEIRWKLSPCTRNRERHTEIRFLYRISRICLQRRTENSMWHITLGLTTPLYLS